MMKDHASRYGMTIILHGIPDRSRAVSQRGETKKERKKLIYNQDVQLVKHLKKKEKVMTGNQAIGFPAALTILVHMLHGWHQSL